MICIISRERSLYLWPIAFQQRCQSYSVKDEIVFSSGKIEYIHTKSEPSSYVTPYTHNIDWKQIIAETTKLLEENTGGTKMKSL